MALRSELVDIYENYRQEAGKGSIRKAGETVLAFSEAKTTTQLIPFKSIQNLIRPLYGKRTEDDNLPCIGDHPDFEYIKNTGSICYHPITTLFMDIENSTRLSLIYNLEDVFRIKNAFIRVAIEIIRAFGGHVHRIMGDAVMAYFGGKSVKNTNSVIDAMNCASLLLYFVKRSVIPTLKREDYDDPFGIRIGIDFGKEEDVLWSCYGYPNINEVTATSFYVDVASKLQHSAGRNQIMLGDSLKKHIDFPDELLDIKTVQNNGVSIKKPYIEPNYINKEGKSINYSQYLLNWKKYLSYSPIAIKDREFFSPNKDILNITGNVYSEYKNTSTLEYPFFPSACVLAKKRGIKFKPSIPFKPKYPFEVSFFVENHGEEARVSGGSNFGNHGKKYIIRSHKEQDRFSHWEQTLYKGFHYMIVKVWNNSFSKEGKIGVYIE